MSRTPRLIAALATTAALLLGGCSSDGGDDTAAPEVPEGMVLVETKIGSIARPEEWKPVPNAQVEDRVAGFTIEDDGKVVGQMDVFVNAMPAGTKADTVDAAVQGRRIMHFPGLRHTRRDFVEVPGAEDGFVTESTYTTADTGEDARSIDQVAVAGSGDYLLVRISSTATAYDQELFRQVVDTMSLDAEAA